MTPTQQMLTSLVQYLLAGGIGAAMVKLLDNIIQHKMTREDDAIKQEREDAKEQIELLKQEVAELKNLTAATAAGQKYLLLDKIQFLARKYIDAGEVDYDDRRRLREMHTVYHTGLGGNGDLDILMSAVDELPLKGER